MKRIIKKIVVAISGFAFFSCENNFLETTYFEGIDVEDGLTTVDKVSTALNGTYYQYFRSAFAGNYAISIGDIPTDITYFNFLTGHWDDIYRYSVDETDTYLENIWNYGYKVIDNSTRIINAAKALYDDSTASEQEELNRYIAEAYGLRGYAQLILVNVFSHQAMVDGNSYSDWLGIVLIDEEPIEAYTQVSRSTIGETYNAIISDFNNALDYFNAAGGDRGSILYFNEAAVYGLLARTYLYLEKWENAKEYAEKALNAKGISTLTYDATAYASLFSGNDTNSESMLSLAISSTYNWGGNSCGTLWSTYNFSPSPKLKAMYGERDIRTSIFEWKDRSDTTSTPVFTGGKFSQHSSGNIYYATNYLVNAPEMFLIKAEADAKNGNTTDALSSLLVVAQRDSVYTDVNVLRDSVDAKGGILAFIKDERARELFQEGFRLYDLRRWGESADVYAYDNPNVHFFYTGFNISDFIFPIPSDEVTSGWGVEQNEGWSKTLPSNASNN